MATATAELRPDPRTVPDRPGCYQFRDGDGRVIYVGKAKSLRDRVSSYFGATAGVGPRTRAMLRAAESVDWIVVDTEVEALHLEYTLIQRHTPRYNVRYRDDKSYPYLVLTTSEEVPRARVKRGSVDGEDRRFGPYAHAYAIRETLDLLLRVFPVRTCSQGVYDRAERRGRPCLLYHIDRCAAPCVGHISVEDHRELVGRLADFLSGDPEPVLRRLEQEMEAAAGELNYEAAARLRDQLQAARKALSKQEVVSDRDEDFDVIGVWEDEIEAAVQAFFVRRGRVMGRKGWTVDKVEDLETPELLSSFLLSLYEEREDEVPPLVLTPAQPDEQDALERLLADLRAGHQGRGRPMERVEIRVPQRGSKADLLETVTHNAREAFHRHRLKRAQDFDARTAALRELQEALDLEDAPLRIECYDISHLGGSEVVGSMVVFEDGLARKSDYRRFKLSRDTNDDYAALREVLRRRTTRLLEEQASPLDEDGQPRAFAYAPNLILVDGGPGQLQAAMEGAAAAEQEFTAGEPGSDDAPAPPGPAPGSGRPHQGSTAPGSGRPHQGSTAPPGEGAGLAFAALSKRFEELWRPGADQPVELARGSDALYLVQRIRDEAHRFAVDYQRRRRSRTVTTSALEDVPGIGPARRKALLRRFGSVAQVREAGHDELEAVEGISTTLATAVREHLGDGVGDTRPGAPLGPEHEHEEPDEEPAGG